ncbi:DUF1800 domain-containing protein [Nonlabens mediterrranea]|uniref:DUF1800 domain-containing protein n=1 Tax=Nonlabens mediterrranea TaxID=1419947 RepID=A0ABS0A861_9FLAO|nr:DUF1800 domain-containing protein [Nonlabens mediterrranea]
METFTSCNTATLSPYVPTTIKPWDLQRVRHVVKRLGYGLDVAQENAILAQSPTAFVDTWITDSINYMNTPAPVWGNWAQSDYTDFNSEAFPQMVEWLKQTFDDSLNLKLRAKMTLFWHNHFVTKADDYQAPSWLYQYYDLLQTHALGNFKTLTKEIGKNEAMLVYLNGVLNNKWSPNENYARELFELFTLGANNNYTQTDIVEAARALTGYNSWTQLGAPIVFQSSTFDNTDKIIFGSAPTNFDHDSLIDHLFSVRANEISDFIVKKIYRAFVSPELPSQSIIDQLATTFRTGNWEIVPVLRQLFKSEHFFEDDAIGSIIKDPMDCFLTFIKEANFPYTPQQLEVLVYYSANLGQEYYNPVDVAGWQGDRDWINSSTITGRWQGLEYIMWTTWNLDQELFRNLVISIASSNNDPAIIAQEMVDRFVPKTLHTTADYALATQVFKGDVPQNYYDSMQWNLQWGSVPYQVVLLLQHIFRMPEFQLK